jgi:hypothetical protein
MTQDQIKNQELDRMLGSALASNPEMIIPAELSERVIRKLEKKILFRELFFELFFKVGLILGSLTLLTGILVWINGRGQLVGLYTYFISNWQVFTSLLFLVLITVLIDQVILRFYTTYKKEASLKF